MNIVFIGGGSFRTLPILRAALAEPGLLGSGRVWLVDFDLARAETVARMAMKAPEFAASGCEVRWTDKLDLALPGADLVSVSFPVGSLKVCTLSEQASLKHGFFGSDQLSLSGAFRSITGGVILLDIARRMEKHCPKAWLVDFANPVAVYSGIVNNHTKIKALGICGGFNNHRWDLSRLVLNRDAFDDQFNVVSAGVNHLSFILRGTYQGKELYGLIDKNIGRKGWKPCRMTTFPGIEKRIQEGIARLAEMRRRFGTILFSTEGDGMMHIFFEEMMAQMRRGYRPLTPAQIARNEESARRARAKADADFRAHLDRPLDAAFWAMKPWENPHFAADPQEPTVAVLRALGGNKRQWLAASLPNRGAVKGFKDRTVLEYSGHLDSDGIHPDPGLEIPDCFHGLISSLAAFQTLLGDAVATRDPKLLHEALYAYPLYHNTNAAKSLWKELLRIHAPEMPPVFQKAKDYL